MKITAIVMASGMSKRMNQSKLHMMLGGKKVYEYILETTKQCDFYEVIVASKDDDILEKAKKMNLMGIKNTKYFLGQSESIKAGLSVAKPCDGFMFFVADQPFIKCQTIEKLSQAFNNSPCHIILPYYNGTKGNPVLFPSYLKSELMAIEGDNGGRQVIKAHQDKILKVDIVSENEWMDIDTMEDYQKLVNYKKGI